MLKRGKKKDAISTKKKEKRKSDVADSVEQNKNKRMRTTTVIYDPSSI